MEKTIMLLGIISCIFSQNAAAQQSGINFGELPRPVPTVSSLASYNNVSQTNATGLPEISIPLLQLPSKSQDIQLNISLSYNLLNIKRDEPAADIGTGWSLFSGGVISRNIVDKLDERYYDVTLNGYEKNQFDDIYYYNIPGISGKFKFVRDVNTNSFQLINLSANKVKIEYTRTSNTATLVLNSFTITDAKGNKFLFNDYSLANLNGDPYGGSNEYRSAFFLSKILDANNIEIATFTYEKRSKNKVYLPDKKIYQFCKLKSIVSPGFGKIEYEYIFDEAWKMNDPYQVQKIVLKDWNGHLISGYSFDYSYFQYEDIQLEGGPMEYIYKRALEKVKKLDRNGAVSETTELTYNYAELDPPLKRLITPTKGVMQYEFTDGRVMSIKHYTSPAEVIPAKSVRYDYSNFTNPNISSGKAFLIEMGIDNASYNLYRNVKVIDDNNGYTKYYYKTPDDFPQTSYTGGGTNDKFWPYYSTVSGGLLEKKEIYDVQDRLLLTEQSDYLFENIPGAVDYLLFDDKYSNIKTFSKSIWLKKLTNTSTVYINNNPSIEEQLETEYSIFNFQPSKTKKTVDGIIEEQILNYPETGYSNLSNAHILSIPVTTEEKNDGKLVSKVETKYDNTNNTLPSSILATNISDGTIKTTMRFDLYDDRGNLIQFTPSVGIPTAIVYGYNKTQPIAKIEGATYAQISPYIQPIIDASNLDAQNPDTESVLLLAFDNFRKTPELKNFQITTISYDPLIGITTTTPPNGIREIYRYNVNNQLEKIVVIVDTKEVVLKEYQYNYKN
ncbi:hypothetical protein [Chryseobacterium arthrosphaerae]|uniref:hypothetical protein n=1 Tax=Chryseobacterium arthrosphaerae TaxID=651561 RepID=UPI0031E21A62